MSLGSFLRKASRAIGSAPKTLTNAVSSTAINVATAAKNIGSGAAVALGKGVQGTTKAIGKIGIGKFNVANVSRSLTHAGIGPVSIAGASDAINAGIRQVSSIPILGSIVGVSTGIHVVNAANNFARGQRIDRSAISILKNRIKNYKEVAPYAASVVSFVPGIGPGIGAGIAAGAALVDGKRWDQIAIEAAKGSIPGGNIAKAAFDVATSAAQGKPIDQIALSALPVDTKVKEAIAAGLALTKDLASGKRVDQALLNRVNNALNIAGIRGKGAEIISSSAQLARDLASGKRVEQSLIARLDDAIRIAGPEVARALQVGTAIGTAKRLQDTIIREISSPKALNALASMGLAAIQKNKVLQQGFNMNRNSEFRKGFSIGSGIMLGKKGNTLMLQSIRNTLPVEGKKGFDVALAYFIGKNDVNKKPLELRNPPKRKNRTTGMPVIPKKAGPAQSFAFFATQGLVGAGKQQKVILVKNMVKNSPSMRNGAHDAILSVARDRQLKIKQRTFWENMARWVTIRDEVPRKKR